MDLASFSNPVTVEHLQRTRCAALPKQSGIYMILCNPNTEPSFLLSSIGGWHKGKDPTVDIAMLRGKWVNTSTILYIGRAVDLRSRVDRYMQYGMGLPRSHHGGRYIWQLDNSGQLLVTWKSCPDPVTEESRLLTAFADEFGALPFANLRS